MCKNVMVFEASEVMLIYFWMVDEKIVQSSKVAGITGNFM